MRATTYFELPVNVPMAWHTSRGSQLYLGGYHVTDTGDDYAVSILPRPDVLGVGRIDVALCDNPHHAEFIAALLNAELQRA